MPILTADQFSQLTGESTAQTMSKNDFNTQFGQSEDLPTFANGLNPDTPINTSPVSVSDRFKLSIGSDTGNIKYLKDNYGEVRRLPKSGDLVIKDKSDGLWKRVDAKGFGNGDPWEIAKDLADIVVPATAIGAQIGAGILTGGASIAAQAGIAGAVGLGTKGAETVLGKIVGTYDQEPEEQMKEIALEGLLNIGGTAIAAGIKPTAGFIAKKLASTADILSKIPEASRDIVAQGFGMNIKGGARSIHTLIDNVDDVNRAMKIISNSDIPEEAAKLQQVADIKSMATNIKQATSNFYGKALDEELYKNIPGSFASKTPEVIKQIEGEFFDKLGITKLTDKGEKVLLSLKELSENPRVANGELNQVLGSEEAYQSINKLWSTLQNFKNVESRNGVAGAKDLIDIRRKLSSEAFAQAQQLQNVLGTGAEAAKLATQFSSIVKNTTGNKFVLQKEIPTNFMYKEVNGVLQKVANAMTNRPLDVLEQSYGLIKKEISPLRNAYEQAVKRASDEPYEQLVQNITSRLGTKAKMKSNLEISSEILKQYGSKAGKEASDALRQVKIYDAAKDFMPILKPGMIQVLASGGAIGSLASGNEKMATGFAATGLLTSPRATAALIKNSLLVPKFLKTLTPLNKINLLRSPEALNQIFSTAINSEGLKNQITSQLVQGAAKQIYGGQK